MHLELLLFQYAGQNFTVIIISLLLKVKKKTVFHFKKKRKM